MISLTLVLYLPPTEYYFWHHILLWYIGRLFLCLIHFEKTDTWVSRRVEPFGHGLAIGYPLAGGIFGIVYETINPMPVLPGWCWFLHCPTGRVADDTIDCVHGRDDMPMVSYFFVAGPLAFGALFVIVVSMLLIIQKVRKTEHRIQRYAGGTDNAFERTKEVRRQALLCIVSFLLIYFPVAGSTSLESMEHVNKPLLFVVSLLIKTFTSMQGFLNCVIFLRNQYRALTAQREPLYLLRRLRMARNGTASESDHGAGSEGACSPTHDKTR